MLPGANIAAATLCTLTGLSDRRHRQLAKEGFFPPPLRGQYVLVATLQGLFRYYREAQTRRVGTLAEEKEMKVRAERQLLELDLAKKRGELLEVESFDKLMESIFTPLKEAMTVLGSKFESRHHPGLTGRACREIIDHEVNEILANASRPTPSQTMNPT